MVCIFVGAMKISIVGYHNISYISDAAGVEHISAIAVYKDGSERVVKMRKSRYELHILLNFIQKKYKIKPVIVERLVMLFEDDFSQLQLVNELTKV